MDTIWEGRVVGIFHGYKGGRAYELSDGSKWAQDDRTDEPVYREDPRARLLRDRGTGKVYLDVEGTSAVVLVVEHGSRIRPVSGAF